MEKLFTRLINRGTDPVGPIKTVRNVRFLNTILLVAITNVFIYIIKNLLLARYDAAFFESVTLGLLFFAFWLNKKNHIAAYALTFVLMEAFFLLISLYLFPGHGVELFFLFIAIVPHIFFNNTLWTVLIFLINLALYFVPQLIIHPYDDKNFSYMVPITVFTVIFIIVRFFRLQVESYENKLNITNQKLGQDKLVIEQQRESLRALDEEKSAFFTNVTHEFRTPLTLIKGLAENLKPQVLNTEQRKELEVIEINAAKLSGMIDEILKLARTGKVDYSLLRSPVLMHAFFGKHADIFGVIAKKKGIGFQIETHPRNLTLLIDESKFDQIMTNLISNAIKFSPQGGAIYLKAFEHEKHIEIQIKDEGIGVAEQEQEMIFERFTSYAQTNHQTGTGIGLSLVKELVGLHHGEICVAPDHEKGTCFKLMLPRECLTVPVADETQSSDVRPVRANLWVEHDYTVLLVDDNGAMRQYIANVLGLEKYRFMFASNGVEALEILKENTVSLIILDYMMPLMDGYETAQKIKDVEQLRNTPILFLTARATMDDKLKVLQLGVDDYLLKPFDRLELTTRVVNLLKQADSRKEFRIKLEANERISEGKDFLAQFKEIVELRIAEREFTIKEMAQALAITERSLYRKVKSLTGMTVNGLIQEIKLQYARQLLERKTFSTLKQVSFAIGIETTGYFTKIYENRFGRHPTDY